MYDVIVVGARCAGSPTAMLLARKGHRVLLVDRMGFPSDKMSTHYIHAPGVLRLQRWGLLDAVRATGAPDVTMQSLEHVDFRLRGFALPFEGVRTSIGPRRVVLDRILLEAAAAAGSEVRERFTVRELLWDDGRVVGIVGSDHQRGIVRERAAIVIGADGMHSRVAEQVQAPRYDVVPTLTFGYYSYWSGLDFDGDISFFHRDGRIMGAIPTNDGLHCVFVQGPTRDFAEFRRDVEGNYLAATDLLPRLGEQVRAGRREERFVGTADSPNFFRKPYGPGWALVGDAGYHRDPVTGQGIMDAFQSAELLADAIHDGLTAARPMDDALAAYEDTRNARVRPFYQWTQMLAMADDMPAEVVQLMRSIQGNREQIDLLFGMAAGVTTPAEFFAPANIAKINGVAV